MMVVVHCRDVQISSTVNVVFTVINLAVIVCIIGIGIFYADVTNWTQSPGGFFPFGFTGVSSLIYLFITNQTKDPYISDVAQRILMSSDKNIVYMYTVSQKCHYFVSP